MGSDGVGTSDLVLALGSARHVDEIATIALRFLTAFHGAVRAGVALSVVGGRQLRFLSSDASLEPPLQWCSIDAYDRLPLNDAVRTGRHVVLDPIGFEQEYPELFARQDHGPARGVVALALRDGQRRLGGLLLYSERVGADPGAEIEVLIGFCAEVVSALLAAESSLDGSVDLVCEHASKGGRPLESLHLRLPADETAPGAGRRFVREALEDWGVAESAVEAALLCASEVITNVVLHARESSLISAHRHDDRVIVHVHQASSGEVPEIRPAELEDPLSVAGRGLLLVEAMSSRWGTTSTGAVSCVWYELDLLDGGGPLAAF